MPTQPQPKPPAPPTPPPAPKPNPQPEDPQAAKLEAHAVPPRWDDPAKLKAHKPQPPDGPNIADLQRESSAELERTGMPRHDPAPQTQVPGVAPPAKRS